MSGEAMTPKGIEERDGRWWLNGGEVTAPVYSPEHERILYPPWWPVWTDPATGEQHIVGRVIRRPAHFARGKR